MTFPYCPPSSQLTRDNCSLCTVQMDLSSCLFELAAELCSCTKVEEMEERIGSVLTLKWNLENGTGWESVSKETLLLLYWTVMNRIPEKLKETKFN